ncbi:hypothetical protein [Cohnella herbarum]|uniref:Uncharacterized protein n=1 Tax=Cohnella herbarum TaxID=2728023 RepID=A0A7Z2VMX6_9BACL|nr:hypothetical protein [Cohnella herbarum]QJD85874.1 hypothetical protein HH215_23615 [Cohnella herbarum]
MRKMTLTDIQNIKRLSDDAVEHSLDYSVALFRGRKQQPQQADNLPPRSPDEIKALNYLARNKLLTAMSNGTVQYDAERRVLRLAKYTTGE